MEDQKLCKNCIEWLKNKHGDRSYITPFSHCHHPEPSCWWCWDWLAFEKDYKDTAIYEVVKKLIGLSEEYPKCPVCERRLKW